MIEFMENNNRVIKRRKSCNTYATKFLKSNTLKRRGDKNIYVRPEYHERLSRIVEVIGKGDIPLYAYLDNILKDHFDLYSGEIIENFNKNNKPIF